MKQIIRLLYKANKALKLIIQGRLNQGIIDTMLLEAQLDIHRAITAIEDWQNASLPKGTKGL